MLTSTYIGFTLSHSRQQILINHQFFSMSVHNVSGNLRSSDSSKARAFDIIEHYGNGGCYGASCASSDTRGKFKYICREQRTLSSQQVKSNDVNVQSS